MTFLYRDSFLSLGDQPVATGSPSAAAERVEVGFTTALPDLGDLTDTRVLDDGLADLAARTGCRPVVMRQVHGNDVWTVDQPDPPHPPPRVDALVAARPGVALVTRAADCVPVLIAATNGVIAAVHAGRRGVEFDVVGAAVTRMRELGASGRLTAWVGPHICGACYEVPEQMRDQVAALVPVTRGTTSWGTPSLDLGAGVRSQLEAHGARVVELARCTREDESLPSYRREGLAAGRMAGVIWWTP